jgi:hypothetical protein
VPFPPVTVPFPWQAVAFPVQRDHARPGAAVSARFPAVSVASSCRGDARKKAAARRGYCATCTIFW